MNGLGGIAGMGSNMTMEKCYNAGTICSGITGKEPRGHSGGMCGIVCNYVMEGEAFGCTEYRAIGGENVLSLCFNEGKIIGCHSYGGICGWFDTRSDSSASGEGIIETCINIGDIESRSTSNFRGGIVGGAVAVPTGLKVLRCVNFGKFIRYS